MMEKFMEKFMRMRKLGLGPMLLILCFVVMITCSASAQSFYIGGSSSQNQWMLNDGMITNTVWQDQIQVQQTVLGIEDMPVAQVNTWMEGYMVQEIGNDCSAAYTETGNSSHYGVSIDSSNVSVGASAGSYSFSATSGNAFGYTDAYTDVSIIILP